MLLSLLAGLAILLSPRILHTQVANTTSRAQAELALDAYFAAMRSQDFSHVAYTRNTVFRGSLHTEPIHGDSAVREFFVAVAKGARSVQPQWRVIDGDRACT